MIVDLGRIPEGWHLKKMRHVHTDIRYAGETHEPVNVRDHGYYPWMVDLQHRTGGKLCSGLGETPGDALARAILETNKWN